MAKTFLFADPITFTFVGTSSFQICSQLTDRGGGFGVFWVSSPTFPSLALITFLNSPIAGTSVFFPFP